jgi:hypothetical protein
VAHTVGNVRASLRLETWPRKLAKLAKEGDGCRFAVGNCIASPRCPAISKADRRRNRLELNFVSQKETQRPGIAMESHGFAAKTNNFLDLKPFKTRLKVARTIFFPAASGFWHGRCK